MAAVNLLPGDLHCGVEGHGEAGDEEVGHGQGHQEVVVHVTEPPVDGRRQIAIYVRLLGMLVFSTYFLTRDECRKIRH